MALKGALYFASLWPLVAVESPRIAEALPKSLFDDGRRAWRSVRVAFVRSRSGARLEPMFMYYSE